MTNKIKIDLELTGESATARGLDHVGDKVEDFGDDLKQAGKDAGFLDKRLTELRGSTRALAEEFARSGDKDLLKQLKGANRELGELLRIRKQLGDGGSGGSGMVGGGIVESFSRSISAGGSPVVGGIAGAAAASAPFLGASIGAAVLGAVGTGGIIGGIAAAARDSGVRQEAQNLGRTISDSFTELGKPFTAPLIESMQLLEDSADDSLGKLREGLGTLSPVLLPLSEGLGGLVDKTMPGLVKALESAKPVLRTLGSDLPELGDAFSDMFDDIASHPEAASAALHDLLMITGQTARGIGQLTSYLSSYYEVLVKTGAVTTGWVNDVGRWMEFISPLGVATANFFDDTEGAMKRANDASRDFRNITNSVVMSQYQLGGALVDTNEGLARQHQLMYGMVDAALDLRRSTQDVEQAIDSFTEAVDENGTSLDMSTDAGRRNRDAVEAGIDALKRGSQAAYDNAIATGGTVLEATEAAAAYRAQWIPALQAAAEKAGYNAEQVRVLLDVLNKLDGKQVSYRVIQQGGRVTGIKVQGGTLLAGNDIDGRASGGPVYPGRTYRVGEHGVELLEMGSTGGYVHNASATKAMMSGATAAAAPAVNVSVNLVPSGNINVDAIMQMLWPALLKQIRVDGGDLTAFGAV